MRERFADILKKFFRVQVQKARTDLGLSQEEMAHRLAMTSRSYSDLEHGETCCGAVTLALFLIYLCEDPQTFIKELQHAFETKDNEAA